MKLSELVPQERILPAFKGGARPKRDVLAEMLSALMDASGLSTSGMSQERLLDALLAREAELSTSAGEGFAFPHLRVQGLNGHGFHLLAVSPQGVGFETIDAKPVHFILLSIAPVSNADVMLQARAALLKFVVKGRLRDELLSAESSKKIWELMDESGVQVGAAVRAKDLMRPQWGFLYPDMTLREAAAALRRARSESLPIVDERGQYAGEFSCLDILSFGLADGKSNQAPLERFFKAESALTVGELKAGMAQAKVAPDASLEEIISEIARDGRQQLYVVEAGRVLGVIDRADIVDKVVLNS